jgi:hypothetical protein
MLDHVMYFFSDEISTDLDMLRVFKYSDLRFSDLIDCYNRTLDASSSERQAMRDN